MGVGIHLGDVVMVPIQHPTFVRHLLTMRNLEKDMERHHDNIAEVNKIKQQSASLESFMKNEEDRLGFIVLASGLGRQTPTKARLDWALIQPTEKTKSRVGKNLLPDIWTERGMSPPAEPAILKQPPSGGLKSVEHGSMLYKVGADTGLTSGPLNTLTSMVTWRDGEHLGQHRVHGDVTEELSMLGASGPADEGAVVFDSEGRAVGMVSAQQPLMGGKAVGITYVTPIEDVFEDIKALSGGDVTAIRIAED